MQRAVLARELSSAVDVLIVANPCFGLDFASVAEIRAQIMEQRNSGAAVLLVSEDLDEILELADRIAVMSGGRIDYVVARRRGRPHLDRPRHGGALMITVDATPFPYPLSRRTRPRWSSSTCSATSSSRAASARASATT